MKLGALCFYSSVVLVDSFVLRNPARTQSPETLYDSLKQRFVKLKTKK